ncbi:MAG TPA: hypothetical protein VGM75_38105 [Pseudonocardiaceae bacterium]|jgi:hypothetical protein
MTENSPQPVAGVYREDVERLDQALAGASYPAEKWQLISHVVQGGSMGGAPTDRRTIEQMWALPTGHYANFHQVLAGVARTARGHPRRAVVPPRRARTHPVSG